MARIELEGDLTVCAMAESAQEAMRKLPETNPDLVVTDLSLSGKPGLELVKEIRAARPLLPILVLSIHDEELWAERVIRAGAQGYVMKAQATDKVMDAIRRVLAGGLWLSEKMNAALLGRIAQGRSPARPVPWRDCLIASWKYSR